MISTIRLFFKSVSQVAFRSLKIVGCNYSMQIIGFCLFILNIFISDVVQAKIYPDSIFVLSPKTSFGRLDPVSLEQRLLDINSLDVRGRNHKCLLELELNSGHLNNGLFDYAICSALRFTKVGQYSNALKWAEIAQQNLTKPTNVLALADVLRVKAYLLFKLNHPQQAGIAMQLAIDNYVRIEDFSQILVCYTFFSDYLFGNPDFPNREAQLKEAVSSLYQLLLDTSVQRKSSIFKRLQIEFLELSYLLANHYVKDGNYKGALNSYKRALMLGSKDYSAAGAIIMGNISGIYFRLGNRKRATEMAYLALSNSRQKLFYPAEANALVQLSQLANDNRKVFAYLDMAIAIFRSLKSNMLLNQALAYKALRAERLGKVDIAVQALKEGQQLKDSIVNMEQMEKISGLETTFKLSESALKIKELQLLNLKREERNNQYLIGSIVIFFSSIVLIILLFRLRTLNKRLKANADELDSLNTFKSKVFFILGHDVSGVLAGMSTILHILHKHGKSVEDFNDLINHLFRLKNSALDMLEKLFIWGTTAVPNIGKLGVVRIPHEILGALDLASNLAAAKNVRINKTGFDGNFFCRGNAEHIEFILRNLLSNAVKFSNPYSVVEIYIKQVESELKISVCNTSKNILSKKMDMIFSGTLGSTEGTSGERGSGAGLMLCKKIADLDGYRLLLEHSINEKVIFSLYLPICSSTSQI